MLETSGSCCALGNLTRRLAIGRDPKVGPAAGWKPHRNLAGFKIVAIY